jgi:very-short-patch-repair endonuclease
MADPVLRRLARDHWVRLHGTPRVTLLVGGDRGRALWTQWLALSGMTGTLLEGELDARLREAVARAIAEPAHPIAVLATAEVAIRWRSGRQDRLAALADEGWTVVPDEPAASAGDIADRNAGPDAAPGRASRDEAGEPGASGGAPARGARPVQLDARSAAEAALYEALAATPATAGRFQLNESLSVRFGPAAAEVDLLSRGDAIAIEIDGVHHFADPECYRRDRRKDLLLQTHGFVVVRLLAEDVMRDVRSAVNAVCQVLAYRRGERGR